MTNSKVSIATLARTAALAFALANQVSSAAGKPCCPSKVRRWNSS